MITVYSWNINGYKARKQEVASFIQEYQPDILCLTETKTDIAYDENFQNYN